MTCSAHGCHLMPDSITEAQDYDEKTKRRTPAVDKLTGRRVCSAGCSTWTQSWRAGPVRPS